jgi:predicted N-formylglutamate amidohydrolase
MTESAVEHYRPSISGNSGLIFFCDHAANALPAGYGTLGLEDAAFATHIAYDIGAAEVCRALATAYGAPAVLARYSRLLIDLNRGPDDPTLVMKLSDGRIIPGNRNVGPEEIENRLAKYHRPYHEAIAAEIAAAQGEGRVPVLISLHSFTPVWKGFARPWQVGVLWDRDDRLARPLMAELERGGFVTGDNEPYSGALQNDCLWRHGTMNGLPHVLIEVRQDLLATPEAADGFAIRLKPVLDRALAAMGPAGIRFARAACAEKDSQL